MAIRVICILDKYVAECATVSGDDGEEDEQGCTYPEHNAPDVPTFPSDVDWHSIDHELMYELLSLPAAAEKAAAHVSGASEHSFPPDFEEVFEARCEEYGNLALKANSLAARLRRTYSIPELPEETWSPIKYAQEQLDDLKAAREKRAALYRKKAMEL